MIASSRWFNVFQSVPTASVRLFCFPHGGGGTSTYRLWPSLVGPRIELLAARLPGREVRIHEPAFTSMAELVHALLPEIRPYANEPFALFGHSMGALIAFEVARGLRRHFGVEPVHLFASGRPAPHLLRRDTSLQHLSDRELLETLQERCNGVPPQVAREPELIKLLVPMLRADVQLFESYECAVQAPLDCPITALCGREDPVATEDEVLAWREHTTGLFDAHVIPGDHFFLNSARNRTVEIVRSAVESTDLANSRDGTI